ncbi:hypothetical protein [Rhizobium sp. RCAM05973]|uniref:hypothetical protein n=1 Tax=Rhizobium sp. RCAM05973 TaxID=2994066 RepID=UPI0022EC14BD|nr:hypothetical protein [Rhizobium sp. RCAM05973]
MRKSEPPWIPPITGTPLDYVPIDAPIAKTKPFDFKTPFVRRSLMAAYVASFFAAAFVFPPLGLTVIALAVIGLAVYGGSKLADKLDDYDDRRQS